MRPSFLADQGAALRGFPLRVGLFVFFFCNFPGRGPAAVRAFGGPFAGMGDIEHGGKVPRSEYLMRVMFELMASPLDPKSSPTSAVA